MDCQRLYYKWKIIAWSALKKDDEKNQKLWILNESCWFGNKKACIKDFKEVTRNGDEIFIKT